MDLSHIPAALTIISSSQACMQPVAAEVDARNLACPLPLLKARQGLRNLASGDLLRVLATDSGSLNDFVAFARLTGQVLEAFYVQDDVYCYIIRKC